MSYDGGLVFSIMNKKLGEVLDEFSKNGYFPVGIIPEIREQPERDEFDEIVNPEVKYTLYYSYMDDCSGAEGCPQSIEEVGDFLISFISYYEYGITSNALKTIKERITQRDVIEGYTFVNWQYYAPHDGKLKEFTYQK